MSDERVTFRTITTGERGLRVLRERVAELNKRAAKLGLSDIEVTVTQTVAFVPVWKGKFGQSVPMHTVDVRGVEPRINGWRLAAKIEFNDTLGNIVKTVPGIDHIDPKYRNVGPVCEHCNTTRRRNDVFVLRHANGDEKIVGRNCFADFLRNGDAGTLTAYAEFIDSLPEFDGEGDDDCEESLGGWGFASNGPVVTKVQYLAMVSCCIRKFGWLGRTAAREFGNPDKFATADLAGRTYWGRYKDRMNFIEKNDLYPTEFDNERAERALEWAKTKVNDRSEYLHTIGKLAEVGEWVEWRYDGYLASIISAYLKDQDQEIERAKRKAARYHVGEEGERLKNLAVTVVRMRFTEGMYGTKTILTFEHTFKGPNGEECRAVLTWFASGDKSDEYTEGDEALIDCTVKEHENHETYGVSTIVQRVSRSKPPKSKKKAKPEAEANAA